MAKTNHLFSLVNRILFLFASLVLVLFLVIFIFAYNTTKSEFEQKVYYKIERVGILLEPQLKNTNIQLFEGNYIIGEINTKIKIAQRDCTNRPPRNHLAEACLKKSGFVAQKVGLYDIETFFFLNTPNNLVIQVSVLHSQINAYVLTLTSKILTPYLVVEKILKLQD